MYAKDGNMISEMPFEITSLIDRELMFKIQVKDDQRFGQPFNVVAICCDGDVISKYSGINKSFKKENGPSLQSIIANSTFVDEDIGSSSPPTEFSQDYFGDTTPNTSISNSYREHASLKRNLDDEFSATKSSKKMKTIVKVEKD